MMNRLDIADCPCLDVALPQRSSLILAQWPRPGWIITCSPKRYLHITPRCSPHKQLIPSAPNDSCTANLRSHPTTMSLSSLRVVPLKRAVPRLPVGSVRFAHSDHGHHHHLPFQWKNRRAFAIKYTAFVTTGFMIPFIAVGYQLRKSQGSA